MGATGEILNSRNSIPVSGNKEWIQALETLILNRNLAKSMGTAGRRHAEENFDFKTVADRFYSALTGS
jgi:glycosyltransferase involved in cell wall biosynthesis